MNSNVNSMQLKPELMMTEDSLDSLKSAYIPGDNDSEEYEYPDRCRSFRKRLGPQHERSALLEVIEDRLMVRDHLYGAHSDLKDPFDVANS